MPFCFRRATGAITFLVLVASGSNAQSQGQSPAQTPKAAFRFADQTVNIPAGELAGSGSVILTVEGEKLPTTGMPAIVDVGQPSDFAAEPGTPKQLNGGQGFQNWFLPITVKGLKTVGSRERYLTVQYAGIAQTLSYSIDNASPAGFTWKVTPPAAGGLAWAAATALPITIAVGGSAPATNLTLSQPLLVDPESQQSAEFKLCASAADPCLPPSMLPAGRPTTVYLRQTRSEALAPGSYAGTLALSASEQPQGDTFAATLHVTSNERKWVGLAAILAGVLLSWLFTVYVRHLINRSRLRRVAAVLRERLERLATRLAPIEEQWRRVLSVEVSQALEELAEPQMKARGFIPDRIPSATQDAATGEFQNFVARFNARIDGLEVIAVRGLEPLYAMLRQQPSSQPIKTALRTVDAKALEAGATPLAALTAEILRQVADASGQAGLQQDAVPEAPSVRQLTYQIGSLNLASWLSVIVTTVLVGVLVLILPDKGFGQGRDYMICLLWGLGIPVAGAQLSQLNAGTVNTSFGVTKPT